MKAWTVAALVLVGGCGAHVVAVRQTVTVPSAVRVEAVDWNDSGLFVLQVQNLTTGVLIVHRDLIRIASGGSIIAREPGGYRNVYQLQAGESQQVNLKFDLSRLEPGMRLRMMLQGALTLTDADGMQPAPVEIQDLTFAAR